MTHLENKIAKAILKEIANEAEGTFEVEMWDKDGSLIVVEGRFVTEGRTVGGDYYTPGEWVVGYANVTITNIVAFDKDGDEMKHGCKESEIEEFVTECLYAA